MPDLIPESIDTTAPVVVRLQTEIDALVDSVWAVHVGVADWPSWQPDIEDLRTDAPVLHPGGWFSWSSGGLAIRSDVHRVDAASHSTLWGGPADGVVGLHLWRFEPTSAGGTRVSTEESWSGAAVEADVPAARQALTESLQRWLARLTARSLSISSAEQPG